MWEVDVTNSADKHSDIGAQHFGFFISLQQPMETKWGRGGRVPRTSITGMSSGLVSFAGLTSATDTLWRLTKLPPKPVRSEEATSFTALLCLSFYAHIPS